MAKSNYYADQLSKIDFKADYAPKFKVTDAHGNDTKWMDLNSESIDAILKWLNKEIKESIDGLGGGEKSVKDIQFKTSNLYLYGFGKDTNGNSVVKIGFPNKRAFSIQTNGTLKHTHSLVWKKKLNELTDSDISNIEKEVNDYVSKYGSKEQKSKLKIYGIGSTKTATDSVMAEIEKTKTISEKTLKLLLRRKNAGEKFDDSVIWDNEIVLSKDQSKKGLDWLKNLWKSPTGKERSTNPFGSREESIIESAKEIHLRGFYDAGNSSHSFWVPLYRVEEMEYYVSGGKINIVG